MHRFTLLPGLAVILLVILLGCSGSGSMPSAPGLDNGAGTPTQKSSGNVPLTGSEDRHQQAETSLVHQIWGLYECSVEPGADKIDAVPIRSASLHLNALKFLEPNGKAGGLQVAGPLQWSDGNTVLDLDLRIVHPFPSAMQFSGFDVKGIFISRGTQNGFADAGIATATAGETRLLNPDGYTRWWNPREFVGNDLFSYRDGALGAKDSKWHFESTMNGFKYFADTLSTTSSLDTLNQGDRGAFRAGKSNVRHYKISLKGGGAFNYAVDASWVPPTVNPPVVPDDFPSSANQPEPWMISSIITENTLYCLSPSNQGGHLALDIRIYDWQSPLPEAQGGTIKKVVLEWPGVFDPAVATFVSDQGSYGLYNAILSPKQNALTTTSGVEYFIWAESTDGAGYGGKLPISTPLVAAGRFSATVSTQNPPPQITAGVLGNANPAGGQETFSVTAFDPNGDPLTYSWSVEFQGNPYVFDDPGNGDGTILIDWSKIGTGDYTVQCEVSDGVNPAVMATALDVHVGNTPPQVGQVTGKTPVTSLDTNELYQAVVNDPDTGQTLTYKWSIVPAGNPENFVLNANGDGTINVDWSTYAVGSFDVNLRVGDGIDTTVGTKLTVVKENLPPTIGEITGPNPVNCLTTSAKYTSAIVESDPGQTLTIMWSIVSSGSPANFNIPAAGDGSMTKDWSGTAIGDYDINVQADDGYVQVAGTALTVTKENTAPQVGAVDGPASVTVDDVSAYSLVPESFDCDAGQTLDYRFSIVPKGNPANYNIISPDGTVSVDWSAYGVGQYTIGARVSDGTDQSFATSLDVIVSLASCTGSAHSFTGKINLTPYSMLSMSVLPRRDIAFLDAGQGGLKGMCLSQIGPSTLGLFDTYSTGPANVLFTYFLGKVDAALSLDSEPVTGRVLVVTADNPSEIKIMDPSIIFGDPFIGGINSGNEKIHWIAVDAAANGDIWAVRRDATSSIDYKLFHFKYLANDPYYQLDSSSTTDITTNVGSNTDIFDIAVNQKEGYLYLFEAGENNRGVLHSYQLIAGAPAVHASYVPNIISQDMKYDFDPHTGFAGYGDIDIDHVNPNDEACRILVYARLANYTSELVRLDNNFNVLDRKHYTSAWPGFAINPATDKLKRNLAMPDTDTVGFWAAPADW